MNAWQDHHTFATARCWSCGQLFTFDPDLVPAVPIDPVTKAPPDQPPQVEGGYERAVKQPVCGACVELANVKRREMGRPVIHVLPGAYPFGEGDAP